MTRVHDADLERKQAALERRVFNVLNGGLDAAVGRAGGELLGFSVKGGELDCLVVVRAEFPAGGQVAFFGGTDLPSTLIKAEAELKADRARWREDRFSKR